jgi:hypothetical protein
MTGEPVEAFVWLYQLLVALLACSVGYFWIWPWKTVFLDGETLIVKSWRKETRVPLKTVVGMGNTPFFHSPRRVWIEYAMPNEVVRLVVFIPGIAFFPWNIFRPHRNEELLRQQIVKARKGVGDRTGQGSPGLKSRSVHVWNWKIPLGGTLLSVLLFWLGLNLLKALGG